MEVAASQSATGRFSCPNPKVAVLAGLMFFVGVGLTAARVMIQYQTPGPFDPGAQGMCDFHNGIYFPTRALIDGVSPYSQTYSDDNPVARQIPFFSPVILVLHAPLVLLPLQLAEWIYFVFSVAMILLLAWLAASAAGHRGRLDWILTIAAAMVFSRSGHITLFDGYFTLELILGSWVAVHFAKDRPWLSGLALVLVSAKPTYILPLGFLMLARGNYRALVVGAVLSIIGAALPMTWLAGNYASQSQDGMDWSAGWAVLLEDIQTTQEVHMSMEDEMPVNSWTRIDFLAIASKWMDTDPSQAVYLGFMFLMLAVPMWILFRRSRCGGEGDGEDDGIAGMTGALIFTTLIVSVYHQSYDALLVVAPLVGIVSRRLEVWKRYSTFVRLAMAAALSIPLFNYLSTQTFLNRFELSEFWQRAFTSLSGAMLTIGYILACLLAFGVLDRSAREKTDRSVSLGEKSFENRSPAGG